MIPPPNPTPQVTNTTTPFAYPRFELTSIPERDRTPPTGVTANPAFVSMFAPGTNVPGLRHSNQNPWPLVSLELFQVQRSLERLHTPNGEGPVPNFQTDVLQRVQRLHFSLIAARENIPAQYHGAITQVASLYAQLQTTPNPATSATVRTSVTNTFGESVYQTLATSGERDAPYFYVNRSRGPFKSNFFRDHIQPVADLVGLGGPVAPNLPRSVASDFFSHFVSSSSSRQPHETEIRLYQPRLQLDGTTTVRSTPHVNPTLAGLLAPVQPPTPPPIEGRPPRVAAPVNGVTGHNGLVLTALTAMRVFTDAPQVRDFAMRNPAHHSMAVLNSRESLLAVEELSNAFALATPPTGTHQYGTLRASVNGLLQRLQPAIPALATVGTGDRYGRTSPNAAETAVRTERTSAISGAFSVETQQAAEQLFGQCLRQMLVAAPGGQSNIALFCGNETFRNRFIEQNFGPMSTYLQQNLRPNLDTPGHGVGDLVTTMQRWGTANQNRLHTILAAPTTPSPSTATPPPLVQR